MIKPNSVATWILGGMLAVWVAGCEGGCGPKVDPEDNRKPNADEVNIIDVGPRPIIEMDGGDPGDGGMPEGDAGPSPVFVDHLEESNGSMGGGYRVSVFGFGFTLDSTEVFFNESACLPPIIYVPGAQPRVSCTVPPTDTPGPVDVTVRNELGEYTLEDGFTYFSPVNIDSVQPPVASTEGGETVEIFGESLFDGVIVLVGGRQAQVVSTAMDGSSAQVILPEGDSGVAAIEVVDAFGYDELENQFQYIAPLRVEDADPRVAVPGDLVKIYGTGFDDTTTVQIGGQNAVVVNRVPDSMLRVTMPGVGAGTHDILVDNGAENDILADGIVVLSGAPTGVLNIQAVLPATTSLVGGAPLHLIGELFDTVVSVEVDGISASFVVISDTEIEVVAPAHAAGATQITVFSLADNAVIGLTYANSLGIGSLVPDSSLAGGENITIYGAGFTAAMELYIGGTSVAVTYVDANTATFVAPTGLAGEVTVRVVVGAEETRAMGALQYDQPLAVLSVRPGRGGVSGNTFVTITGQGFQAGRPNVVFGELDAAEITVVSDNVITARTPVNLPGAVNVIVENLAESAQLSGGYTYYDPTSLLGGSGGGPITGAVYVTALDATTGFPLANMTVFLGTDGESSHISTTNVIGQATLSGADVYGPQSVSVVGNGYTYASLIDVNATNITVFLFPLGGGGPPGGGTPPTPPPPATISGRVTGFAKALFDPFLLGPNEIAIAVVNTTAADEISGIPNPGGDNIVLEEGGSYTIADSRTGRLAVVALAGILNLETQEFRPRQMGVLRNVFPERGVDLQDHDIELTIPLTEELEVSLPDAPLGEEGGPNITRVLSYIRFGGEGSYFYDASISMTRSHLLLAMPDVPGEMLTFVAGAYRTEDPNVTTSAGTVTLVEDSPLAVGSGTDFAITDDFGRPLVPGGILVVERDDGSKWASRVLGLLDTNTILLTDRAPFSEATMNHHIGNALGPFSEVAQDGNGNLIGGVSIHPVLGIPTPLSPVENGVLENRTVRWKNAPGQTPTFHELRIYEGFNLETYWFLYIDGARSKVPIPRIPDLSDFNDLEALPVDMPSGAFIYSHEAIYAPGLDYNDWNYVNIGFRARRSYTSNVFTFVNP